MVTAGWGCGTLAGLFGGDGGSLKYSKINKAIQIGTAEMYVCNVSLL